MTPRASALALALAAAQVAAGHPGESAAPLHERGIAAAWCAAHDGRAEVVQTDGTRVDCLTATHAVEVEMGPHWAEAIGQSLYYQVMTGRRAGVLLILRTPADYRYWLRLGTVVREHHLPIDTWSTP